LPLLHMGITVICQECETILEEATTMPNGGSRVRGAVLRQDSGIHALAFWIVIAGPYSEPIWLFGEKRP
jgi:hypothetical protein